MGGTVRQKGDFGCPLFFLQKFKIILQKGIDKLHIEQYNKGTKKQTNKQTELMRYISRKGEMV